MSFSDLLRETQWKGGPFLKDYADMAELVDALASGASASNGVEVQVLLSAPFWEKNGNCRPLGRFFRWFDIYNYIFTKYSNN